MAAKENSPHSLSGTPLTDIQAMFSPEKDFWKRAEEIEVSGLDAKNTWTVVVRPSPNVKVLSGKSFYKKKMNVDGSIKKYKVRYVIRGFEQRFGCD